MDQRDLALLRCWTAGAPARPHSRPAAGSFTTIRPVPPARTSRPARSSHVGRRRSAWLAQMRRADAARDGSTRVVRRIQPESGMGGAVGGESREPDDGDENDDHGGGTGVVARA